MMSTSSSAMRAHASPSAVSTGTYQRRGARSSSRKISRTGTEVPMWPTLSRRAATPTPSCGASMIPAAIAILITAARLVNPPRATSTASTTASV